MEWFLKVVKEHYADFNGRARRKEFWMFYLVALGVIIAVEILAIIMSAISSILGVIFFIILGLLALALIVPMFSAGIRRMHDVGKSGWYLLIPIYSLILAITEGEKGDNQYGPDPKA
ncbi:DUF805 domain-containing protein [Prevotella sp. 10(H)]|uniref:DUF805 domain-containing protein n=1 Tax=Prevotella sp. 10(H) TaxID=1158294 RepID=UPI0004A7612B|nr:DUF805 domain-containing protein [Prevotella sp. 10(H)]